MRTAFLVLMALMLTPAVALGHQTGASKFLVHVKPNEREVDTLVTFPSRDLADYLHTDVDDDGFVSRSEAEASWPKFEKYLDANVAVRNDGEPCEVFEKKVSPVADSLNAMWFLEGFRCREPLGRVTIENRIMLDGEGGYRHHAKIQVGDEVDSTVFNRQFPTWEKTLSNSDGAGEVGDEHSPDDAGFFDTFVRYLWEGILHILLGFDHVLFVVGLVLVSRRFERLLAVVTAFTLAHSVTLALAALDVVTIAAEIVEPIIAVSIAIVAAEAWLEVERKRWIYPVVFALGLVHGFGFSYVLRDEVGLPAESLVPALFSFNVGVELGQIAIVGLLFPLRAWIRDHDREQLAIRLVAGALFTVAAWWFVERVFL